MYFWPSLKLTDYEKQFVDYYTSLDAQGRVIKPGVLRRSYTLTLANQAQRDKNIAAATTIQSIQISRRARIMALTFSGNTDSWRLSVRNSNGTLYTNPTPRGQKFPIVSSIIAGSYYNALALGGKTGTLAYNPAGTPVNIGVTDGIGTNPGFSPQFMSGMQSFPWIIEPNWVCQPNETLIFQGEDVSPAWTFDYTNVINSSVQLLKTLNITIYAWEFPGMKF